MNTISKSTAPIPRQTDPTKLVSLLALATGAVAMPQSGQADIIYSNLTANPVTVGYVGDAEHIFNLTGLPGDLQFGFRRVTYSETFPITINTYYVLGGQFAGSQPAGMRGTAYGFAAPLSAGATWSQGGIGTGYQIAVGVANSYGRSPTSGYDHKYLAWFFQDVGGPRFGWVEVSLSIALINPGSGPNVTIWGYAYDNTGAKPLMGEGAVPEPASGALLAMGAMALGARGLRKWRQNRQPANQA